MRTLGLREGDKTPDDKKPKVSDRHERPERKKSSAPKRDEKGKLDERPEQKRQGRKRKSDSSKTVLESP